MGIKFALTHTVAERLGVSRQYVLRIAKVANLDLDTVGRYKAWSEKNEQLVSEIVNKGQPEPTDQNSR